MKVLMTGGGTGGHVNPAIAIANTIKHKIPEAEIAFVGTSRGIENRLVPAEGYPLYHVEVRGFRRSLSPSNIRAAYLALTSPYKAKKLIREFAPDIVIGTGGYACWPTLRAAAALGIPTALYESNAVPGLAVSRLERYVDRIWLNFEESASHFTMKDKLLYVGNPLRGGFHDTDSRAAKKELGLVSGQCMILSYGGSLGAERVNEAALCLMRDYGVHHPQVRHVHATGKGAYEECLATFKEWGLDRYENLVLCDYIYDMPLHMAAADVVVCRSGAMTVSELAMMGKASVLIPSPNVTNNHQYKNAKVLADASAATLIEEKDLADGRLVREVGALLENEARRAQMGAKIRPFAKADVCEVLFDDMMALIKRR